MDAQSEFVIRHGVVASSPLNVRLFIDATPAALSLSRELHAVFRELRYGLVAVVAGWTTVTIIRNLLSWRRPPPALPPY